MRLEDEDPDQGLPKQERDQPAAPSGEHRGADDGSENEGIRRRLAGQGNECQPGARQQDRQADADTEFNEERRQSARESLREPGTQYLPDTPPPLRPACPVGLWINLSRLGPGPQCHV